MRQLWATAVSVVTCAALAGPARGDDAGSSKPSQPTDAELAIFRGSPVDAAPAERHRVHHYYAGNEDFLDLFKQDVDGLGGSYVGVGSDQAYLFIGWMKPDWAWMIDYDDAIEATHLVYQPFIVAAETSDDLIALWDKKNEARAKELLAATYQGDALVRIAKTYRSARSKVVHRLKLLRRVMKERKVTCWLNDAEQYSFVRDFVRAGRARALVGNLLDKQAVLGIADAAKQLGTVIRLYYPSNAEQYWDFTPEYRANILALPVDDRSLLTRTVSVGGGNDYTYMTQKMQNYALWLGSSKIPNVRYIRPSAKAITKGRNLVYRTQQLRFATVEKIPKK